MYMSATFVYGLESILSKSQLQCKGLLQEITQKHMRLQLASTCTQHMQIFYYKPNINIYDTEHVHA